ncbi:MAG TPA: DUF4157 domain-containing protein [Kofleriaceae bacterium]|nr:DUF4157 domain-containing protein [Kofleriaceae bacterium]
MVPSLEERAPAPGKRTLTAHLPAPSPSASRPELTSDQRAEHEQRSLQWRALSVDPLAFLDEGRPGESQAIARQGVAGASAPLPHLAAIQASFGRHDVSGARAEVGGPAAQASQQLGAAAYATGDRVGFARAPDLHTAAHEAAHVVQQRAGVALKGGLGRVGDPYEQHADRVADAVVAGRPAEGILDEMAGGGGGADRGGGDSGGGGDAVQRREDGGGAAMFAVTPGLRFAAGGLGERKRILVSERDRAMRLEMLRALPPGDAIELLLGAEAAELPPAQLHDLIEHLPAVIRAMEPRDASAFVNTSGAAPAVARIFAKLPFMTQLVAWRDISPPERRAEVWPDEAPIDRRSALVSSLSEHALRVLLRDLPSTQVQDLVDYAPPHVVARVRAACREMFVHLAVVGAAEPAAAEPGAPGAPGARDVDAAADEYQIQGEAWDAAHDKHERMKRTTSSDAPDPDTWADLPWMMKTATFKFAPMNKRIGYLGRAGERAYELVRTLDEVQDRAETMAAYAKRHAWAADRLIGDAEPGDLVAVVRALHDPGDVAAVFLGVSKYPQRVPLLLAVMEPRAIAKVFEQTTDRDMPRVWSVIADNVPAATLTAVLRRLSDEEVARVSSWSNDFERVDAMAGRRAAGTGAPA